MGNATSLIHLPAQSGKTRKMTELMKKWSGFIDEFSHANCLNIIFTSNTKILTKQTAKRIINDVDQVSTSTDDEFYMDEEDSELDEISTSCKTIAWIHGKKSLSVNDVFAKITSDDDDDEINNVICCTNKARTTRVIDLLLKIHKKFQKRNYLKSATIWIDEADYSLGIWKKFVDVIQPMVEDNFIQNIVLVSATMTPVYKYLHSIDIEPELRVYPATHIPSYLKFSECEVINDISDNTQNITEQLTRVLQQHSDMVVPGSKWFCPGNTNRKSHEEICDILLSNGFNVLILNGSNKEFRLNGGGKIPVYDHDADNDDELSKILNENYYSQELYERPFAVTGNLCVSRGITFASKNGDNEFIFTHGVIPDTTNGDEGYQMVARLLGNVKEWSSYRVPTIFISTATSELISKSENMAIQIAQKYYIDDCEKIKITKDHELYHGLHKKSRKERTKKNDPRKTVPVIINVSSNEIERMMTDKRKRKDIIMELVQHYSPEFYEKIKDYHWDQCTQPGPDTTSYKKHVIDLVKAQNENKTFIVDKKASLETQNWFNSYIDVVHGRLCFIVWNGVEN